MFNQLLTLLKTRYFLNSLLRAFTDQSLFKVFFVSMFAVLLEVGLTILFYDGFQFLAQVGGSSNILIGHLFSFFFFGLGMLLAVSGIISGYATLFRSRDISFLLSSPVPMHVLVLYKFLQSAFLASWAFYGVIIPFIVAYSLFRGSMWTLPLITLIYSVPFLIIYTGIGAFISMIAVRWIPSKPWVKKTGIIVLIILLFSSWMGFQNVVQQGSGVRFNISSLVPGFKLAENAMFPSYWLSNGIMTLSHGEYFTGLMFLAMLFSTALMVCMVTVETGKRIYFDAWQTVKSSTGKKIKNTRKFKQLLRFPAQDTRALLAKDIKTFFRDPVQWSQFLIFFGLLAFYFLNLRTFSYHEVSGVWRSLIIFLNIFSVSAVICSLAARFIYPQLSLEGQAFWILGLSPMSLRKILLAKFLIAVTGMVLLSSGLIFISSHMLQVNASVKNIAILLAVAISVSVCSLSTGLGAVFMDLTKRNPSAIVSGFGGTLNLVCCLGVMFALIIPFGIVLYSDASGMFVNEDFGKALTLAILWIIAVTAVTSYISLWFGYKSLIKRDF